MATQTQAPPPTNTAIPYNASVVNASVPNPPPPPAPASTTKTPAPGSTGAPAPASTGPTAYTQLAQYLNSIGVANDMNSIGALAAKAGVVSNPSQYIYSEDQNKKLLGILQAGSSSGTSNSSSAGTQNNNNSATGAAINSVMGNKTSSSDTQKAPAPQSNTGSGTVNTSGFIDPDTGAFDSNAYSSAALSDAQDQLQNTMSANQNSYTQGLNDLQTQMDQWTQTWQQQKDFAVNDAKQYGGSYADEVSQHYDQIYAQQQSSFANSKATLNTNFQNANLSAQNQFSQDKQGIQTNVANFGMSQEQFDQSQLSANQKAFEQLSTTYNFTPTDEMASALSAAGITQGMDVSKLNVAQKSLLYNMAPDFFDTAAQAGKSFAGAAADFLTGTYKAQAAALAQTKEQDRVAIAQISASNAEERLALSQERLQLAQGNSAVNRAAKMYTQFKASNTPGAGLLTAATYMSQIEAGYANKGKGVSALSMLDALVKIDTGGQAIRQGQLDLIEKSGTYGNAISRIMTNIGAGVDDNGDLTGSNVTLSPAQVEQIYAQAKRISAEKIASGESSFDAFKSGLDSVAGDPNVDPDQVYGAAPGVDAAQTFIDTYKDDSLVTGSGTVGDSGSGTGSGSSFSVGGSTFTLPY